MAIITVIRQKQQPTNQNWVSSRLRRCSANWWHFRFRWAATSLFAQSSIQFRATVVVSNWWISTVTSFNLSPDKFTCAHYFVLLSLMQKKPGMWVSRPGLGLETDQDHFFEVLVSTLLVLVLVLVSACLVLVLVSEGGLEQDLRLCATATLLVSKVETSKWMCSIIYFYWLFRI